MQGRKIKPSRHSSLIHDPTCEKHALHSEKSLFVSVSRQKIPSLKDRKSCWRYQNYKIPHVRKATAGKSRPETTDTAGKSVPSGLCQMKKIFCSMYKFSLWQMKNFFCSIYKLSLLHLVWVAKINFAACNSVEKSQTRSLKSTIAHTNK